jgi:hypothetical protein
MALTVIKGKFPEIGCEKQQGHKREITFVNQVNDTGSCEPYNYLLVSISMSKTQNDFGHFHHSCLPL